MERYMNDKEINVRITDIWPVSREAYALGGIGMSWCCDDIGWGELCLYFTPDGKLHADTEHMCNSEDRVFMKKVLEKLAERVEING